MKTILTQAVSGEKGDLAMTTVEEMVEKSKLEGRLEGELVGKLKNARKMKEKGFDIASIIEITELTTDELKKGGIIE